MRSRALVVAYFAFLTALCALVFLPSLRAGFFEDDFGYFNVTMQPNWWRGTNPTWDFAGQVLRPITILSIGLQREVFGFHPLPYHVLALGLYLVEGVLVHLVGRRLGLSRVGSLAAATALMLHTSNGWAISWVASTSSNYGAIFALLTVWFLAERDPSRRRVIAAVVTFALALLSREVTMVVPFIVVAVRCVLLDGRLADRVRRSARQAVPLFVVLGVYLVSRVSFAAWAHSRPEVPRLVPILNLTSFADSVPWIPIHTRDLLVIGISPAKTIYQPGHLGFPGIVIASAVVLWALVIWLTVREARAGRWIATAGLAWFAIGIVPPLLLQPDMVYGNYTDLAQPGLSLAIGAIAQHLLGGLGVRWRPIAAAGGIACLALLAVSGGNYLLQPEPAFIRRAAVVEAALREEYPEPPPPGSTVVIRNSHPEDINWLSNGDLVRVMFDDPTLKVTFDPPP